MDPVDAPQCANQRHVRETGGALDPTLVCACAAGLVHMHDCPVSMGLDCLYYKAGEPDVCSRLEAEQLHDRLMQEYLTRSYFHRVRSLAPAGDAWLRRKEELYAFYATVELEEDAPEGQDDEEYERERARLLELRRKREEQRLQKEQQTREERARERARLGIKTVVEKAQEAVASQGNIASSVVDDLELPGGRTERKRRRRRRRKGRSKGPEAPQPPASQASDSPPRKRRRRRRRRKSGDGGAPPA